ncbi:hypothetical protein, partial [Aeromonas sp. EERV15]|uniref:hypothetical protein n=1 Tax=Aeromonas sp. EERV15 TaxID=1833892 RepID=UPI001C3FFFE7
LRPVSDGVKRRAHDADLKRVVVIRSPRPQLVPFKLHQFGQQRHSSVNHRALQAYPLHYCYKTAVLNCGFYFYLPNNAPT